MRRSHCGLILTLLFAAHALAAPNPKLALARKQVDDLELAAAVRTLDEAANVPGNDRATVLEILELQGVSFATLGKTERARDAFRTLLVLDPEHRLTGTQPPRVRTPFYEAKEWALKKGTLTLTPSATVVGALLDTLQVQVSGDVLSLARVVVFRIDGTGVTHTERVGKDGVARLKVGAAKASWSADVMGEHDAVLASVPLHEDLAVKPLATDAPKEPAPMRASLANPPMVTTSTGAPALRVTGIAMMSAGAVAIVVGAIVGYGVLDAQTKLSGATRNDAGAVTGLTQKQAFALDASAKSAAPIANVLFAAGAVVAGTGVALFVVGSPDKPVSVAVGPASVSLSARF